MRLYDQKSAINISEPLWSRRLRGQKKVLSSMEAFCQITSNQTKITLTLMHVIGPPTKAKKEKSIFEPRRPRLRQLYTRYNKIVVRQSSKTSYLFLPNPMHHTFLPSFLPSPRSRQSSSRSANLSQLHQRVKLSLTLWQVRCIRIRTMHRR